MTKEVDIIGLSKGEAIEAMIKGGVSYKDAEKRWKEEGARTKSTGFRAVFYAAMKEGAVLNEKASILKFMEENGASANDKKQYTHFLTIAQLVEDVRA